MVSSFPAKNLAWRRARQLIGCACAVLLATCDLAKLTPTDGPAPTTVDFQLAGDSLVSLGGFGFLQPAGLSADELEGTTIFWSSSNQTVATVSSTGEITGKAIGTTTITATLSAPELAQPVTKTKNVRVRYASVFITRFTDPLTAIGATRPLVVSGRNAAGASVATLPAANLVYTSRNTGVFSVSALGVVTANKSDTATVVVEFEPSSSSPLRDSMLVGVGQVPATLAFATQPGNAATGAAISPAVVVTVLDSLGSVATRATPTITLSIANNPGGATLSGTLAVQAVAGVATFSNISLNANGTGYTLRASATGLPQVTSSAFNVITVGAPSKLAFVVQPTTRQSGTVFNPALQVAVQDANGVTIPNDTRVIAIQIASNPGSATLSGTLAANASAGVASFSNLAMDRGGIGYTLTATAAGLTSATSATFNITPGNPAKLVYVVPPSNVVVNTSITPAIEVAVQDGAGNLVTTASNPVSLAITAGAGTLSGTVTNVVPTAGIVTFSNASINTVGSGVVLTASSSGLSPAPSGPFSVLASGVATKLKFTVQPTAITAGTSIAPAVQVTVQDVNGNTVTSSAASITLSVATGPASTQLTGQLTRTATNGVATFTGVSATLTGSTRMLAVSSGLTSDSSTAFIVTPSPAARLAFLNQPSNTVKNVGFTPLVRVAITDTLGNTVTSSNATVSMAILSNPGGATLGGSTGSLASSGIATFTNLTLSAAGSGYTLRATSGSLTAVTSTAFDIAASGPASKLAFKVAPVNTGYLVTMPSPVEVVVQDANGNTVASANENIQLSLSTNPGGATLSGGAATATVAGVATFGSLVLDKVANGYVLTAAVTGGSGLTSAVSGAFNVAATGQVNHSTIPINAMALVGSDLFFTESGVSSGTVKKVAAIGGTVTTLASALSQPVAVTGDGTNVYWIETADGSTGAARIARVSAAGGSVATVTGGLTITNGGHWLFHDGGFLYFLSGGAIKKISASATNGSPTDLVAGGASELIVSGSDAFYPTSAPSVLRIPLSGGVPATVTTDFDVLAASKRSMVVAGGRVYFYGWRGGQQCIRSAPTGGGILTSHPCYEASEFFVSDGVSFYGIANGYQLYRYPLDFSGSTILASNMRSAVMLLDSNSLYYITTNNDIIKRQK